MTARTVGIAATACAFPESTRDITELCADEQVELSDATLAELDVASVHVGDLESGAVLALDAASRALGVAGLQGADVDLIVDYTVLPQLFLVPVWNLGNKLQHELDAKNAFTLGFSGGGTSNFHVALRFAVDLIASDERIRTALLFGADIAIPGNRIVNRTDPVTVLGDGASAVVLTADADRNVVLGTEIVSDGAYHDVCYIPGGALDHLDREDEADLYRLQIDSARLAAASVTETLRALGDRVLDRAGRDVRAVRQFVCPNLSAADQARYSAAWDVPPAPYAEENRRRRGHVQATDLVANLEGATGVDDVAQGDLILVGSHGMGFTAGVTLVQR